MKQIRWAVYCASVEAVAATGGAVLAHPQQMEGVIVMGKDFLDHDLKQLILALRDAQAALHEGKIETARLEILAAYDFAMLISVAVQS